MLELGISGVFDRSGTVAIHSRPPHISRKISSCRSLGAPHVMPRSIASCVWLVRSLDDTITNSCLQLLALFSVDTRVKKTLTKKGSSWKPFIDQGQPFLTKMSTLERPGSFPVASLMCLTVTGDFSNDSKANTNSLFGGTCPVQRKSAHGIRISILGSRTVSQRVIVCRQPTAASY